MQLCLWVREKEVDPTWIRDQSHLDLEINATRVHKERKIINHTVKYMDNARSNEQLSRDTTPNMDGMKHASDKIRQLGLLTVAQGLDRDIIIDVMIKMMENLV